MTVRVYKGVDGDFRRNDDKIPSGNYELIYNSDKTKAKISYVDKEKDLVEQMLVTDFQDINGVGYANYVALETALAGFFKPSGNGGTDTDFVFNDAAARDSYFNPSRLGLLKIGLEVALDDDGSGNRTVQKWVGLDAPVTYSASFWSPSFGGKAISHTYIADGDELPTDVLVPNTPTKYQLPVTIRVLKDFSITDIGGGVLALAYSGERNVRCSLNASTSLITSANNVVVKLMMYKNGSLAPSAIVKRKVGTGADVGAMSLCTTLDASKDDYFEVFVESDIATTITFVLTNIVISEI